MDATPTLVQARRQLVPAAHARVRRRRPGRRTERHRQPALAGHQAVGVVDGVDLLDRAQHGLEVAGVGQLELEAHLGDAVVAGVGAAGDDVDVLLAECVGDVAQQPRAVERDDLDAGPEHVLPAASPSHSTSISRAAWSLISDTALAQSARCTVTPRPRVTKPMISSPGTGVQHATAARARRRGPRRGCRPRCGRGAIALRLQHDGRELLVRRRRCGTPRRPSARSICADDVVLADRGQQRVEIGVAAARLDLRGEHLAVQSAAPAGPRGGTPSSAPRAGLDHVDAALAARTTGGSCCAPAARRRTAASRATGRPSRPSR